MTKHTSPANPSTSSASSTSSCLSSSASPPRHLYHLRSSSYPASPLAFSPPSSPSSSPSSVASYLPSYIFVITYASYASLYLTRKPFSVVKSRIESDLDLSPLHLGLIDSLFLSLYAAGQFCTGIVDDRWGSREVLSIAFVGSAICCFGMGCLPDGGGALMGMYVLWGANGVFQSCGFPLMIKLLRPWFTQARRGAVLGLWTTSQQVGGIISTALPGYLLKHYSWKSAFLLPSVWVGVCGVALYLLLIENPSHISSSSRSQVAVASQQISQQTRMPEEKTGFLQVLRFPGLFNLCFAYFGVKLVRYTMMMWLPYYMNKYLNYPPDTAAFLSTLFDVGGAFGAILCGFITDRIFGGRRMLVVAPMCLLCGMLVAFYVEASAIGYTTNAVMMFILGLTVAGPDSVLGGAATADLCERQGQPNAVGTAAGLVNGFGSVGAILQGSLTAYIVVTFGWSGLFQCLMGLSLVSAVVILPLAFKEARDQMKH